MSYCLVQDEDSHWYVVPSDMREAVLEHFEAVDRYWNSNDSDLDTPEPEPPCELVEVGGSPSLVTFENYTVR